MTFATLIRRHSVLVFSLCVLVGLSGAPMVQAVTVFEETFDGYLPSPPGAGFPDEFPANDPINYGVPLIAEGADNDWWGARFEVPDSPIVSGLEDIYLDLAVQRIPGGNRPDPDPVGRAGDDAGLLFKIDTSSLTTADLVFDWRTFSAGSTDSIVVGYTTLDLDPFFSSFDDSTVTFSGATPGGGNANRIADFYNHPAAGNGSNAAAGQWWADNWTELLREDMTDGSWTTEVFGLLPGQGELWIAIWIDNGDSDFIKIDNIRVTGDTLIPEPSSMVLAAIGLCLLSCRRRRRRAARS